ncbi:MAG TPA: amylo-alpha-1,6-glucosidase [Candidatus Acidoferrales bacterium]|nr:amylo-alpha-1,6-glucosidase [Candidatus Acidoferrales bacterium]
MALVNHDFETYAYSREPVPNPKSDLLESIGAQYVSAESDSRDGAYHQGIAWPWLIGPFVEGWLRVRGGTRAAKNEARERFLRPLMEHLGQAGLGRVCEIADAEPPYSRAVARFKRGLSASSSGFTFRCSRSRISSRAAKFKRPRSLFHLCLTAERQFRLRKLVPGPEDRDG